METEGVIPRAMHAGAAQPHVAAAQRGGRRAERGLAAQRALLRATVCVGAAVALIAVVARSGSMDRGGKDVTGERKMQLLHRHVQSLWVMHFGAATIGDTGVETGNLARYWNTAEESSHANDGVGAYGTLAIDAAEPDGEAYGEGQKDAESAFVASRGGRGQLDAARARAEAAGPALGGYAGAGVDGLAGASAARSEGEAIVNDDDGMRYDNGCDRSVSTGCVGVKLWVPKGGGSAYSDRDDEPDRESIPVKDPTVEGVLNEPYEEVQGIMKTSTTASSLSSATATPEAAVSSAMGDSSLRAVQNLYEHKYHADVASGSTTFWEDLGGSKVKRSNIPEGDPDAPSAEEKHIERASLDNTASRSSSNSKSDSTASRRHTSLHDSAVKAEQKRRDLISQVEDDVAAWLHSKEQGPAAGKKQETSSHGADKGTQRGRQGGKNVAALKLREHAIEGQLQKEHEMVLDYLKSMR